MPTTERRHAWVAVALLALAVAGCGEQRRARIDYIPTPALAEQALRTALDSWKAGDPVGPINAASPRVLVCDAHRPPGHKLVEYQILGEVPGDGPRWFAVRLKFDNPPKEFKARYGVIGIEPLMVIRHEDYEMVTHWDHHMGQPSPISTESAR